MAKDKAKPIRCVLDATKIPPSAFALPDDGRKGKHLCLKRKLLCIVIAARANPDGTSAYPSKKTMKEETGFPERTIGRLLNDLHRLGILIEGDIHTFYKTRIWTVRLPAVETEPNRIETEPDRTSTEPNRTESEPDRTLESTGSALGGPHTALDLPPIKPPSHHKSASENLCSYSKIAKWLPEDMRSAVKKRGEKQQIDELISEHGGAKFLAALHRYWLKLDPASKLDCKWTAFLESFDGWLSDVTEAELTYQAQERWRRENSEEWERIQTESSDDQMRASVIRRDVGGPDFEIFLKGCTEAEQKILRGFMPVYFSGGGVKYPDDYGHYKTLTRAEQRLAYHLAEEFAAWENRQSATLNEVDADDIFKD
jgi:hypothetical protein